MSRQNRLGWQELAGALAAWTLGLLAVTGLVLYGIPWAADDAELAAWQVLGLDAQRVRPARRDRVAVARPEAHALHVDAVAPALADDVVVELDAAVPAVHLALVVAAAVLAVPEMILQLLSQRGRLGGVFSCRRPGVPSPITSVTSRPGSSRRPLKASAKNLLHEFIKYHQKKIPLQNFLKKN